MPLPTTGQVEKAKLQAQQAQARYQALQARLSEAARKLDTRRKIILGGLLLDAAEKDDRFARVVQTLVGRVSRDQDAKAFEGWETPRPALPAEGGQEGQGAAVSFPRSEPSSTQP